MTDLLEILQDVVRLLSFQFRVPDDREQRPGRREPRRSRRGR